MVRSPISTTRPPRISGLTSFRTLSFLPWLYWDLVTAFSRRPRVLLSRGCTQLVKEEKRRKKSPSGLLISYLSAGNDELNLAAGGADDLGELLGDAAEYAEAVVLGEGGEEVLDGVVGGGAVAAGVLTVVEGGSVAETGLLASLLLLLFSTGIPQAMAAWS